MKKNNKKQFKFFAFWSPTISDEQYRWVKECGYTHLYIDMKYGAEPGSAKLLEAFALCEKYGLKGIANFSDFSSDTNDYSNCAGFDGANVDEPLTAGVLEGLSEEIETFNKKYPEKNFYVNCPSGLYGDAGDRYLSLYKKYLTDNMLYKSISGDDYPLAFDPKKSGLKSHYAYLKTLADFAEDTNSEFQFFLQTMSITTYAYGNGARRPDVTDLRFLHYGIATFGVCGFQHFCYKTPGLPPYDGEFKEKDYALIDEYDQKTSIYFAAQKVIAEMQDFAKIRFDFDWKNVIFSVGEKTENPDMFNACENAWKNFGKIIEVRSDRNALVGCFEHKSENASAVLVVGAEDPRRTSRTEVTLCFDDDTDCVIYCGKNKQNVKTKDRQLHIVVQDGEGAFIVFDRTASEKTSRIPRPANIILDNDGVLTFESGAGKTLLEINGKDKGFVQSGNNVLDKLSAGDNAVALYTVINEKTSESSRVAHFYLPSKDNVSEYEDFCGDVSAVRTYNVYGSGNTVLNVTDDNGGKAIEISTLTERENDWSCFQFLTHPITYEKGKALYLDFEVTPSVFGITVKKDPMQLGNTEVETRCVGIADKKIRIKVPLDEINGNGEKTIDKLYIVLGGSKPWGKLMRLYRYFTDKRKKQKFD